MAGNSAVEVTCSRSTGTISGLGNHTHMDAAVESVCPDVRCGAGRRRCGPDLCRTQGGLNGTKPYAGSYSSQFSSLPSLGSRNPSRGSAASSLSQSCSSSSESYNSPSWESSAEIQIPNLVPLKLCPYRELVRSFGQQRETETEMPRSLERGEQIGWCIRPVVLCFGPAVRVAPTQQALFLDI